ncbi:MAG: hypothetical protein ABSG84_14325 [Acidobacteriaceae bacterium]|jgi:hypothetical protein
MQGHSEATKADQVERLMGRPLLYNNVDGVGELALGFMFLGSVLLQWLPIHSSIWHRYGSFLGFLLLIAVIHYGVKAIKTHVTFPRTGFVEYRRRDFFWRGMIGGAVFGLVFGVSFALAGRLHLRSSLAHLGLTVPAALFGLVFAVAYAYRIARAVPWKMAVAAAMAICSVAIAMLPADAVELLAGNRPSSAGLPEWIFGALWLTITLYGAILMISGAISFVLYLRYTQPPVRTAE